MTIQLDIEHTHVNKNKDTVLLVFHLDHDKGVLLTAIHMDAQEYL